MLKLLIPRYPPPPPFFFVCSYFDFRPGSDFFYLDFNGIIEPTLNQLNRWFGTIEGENLVTLIGTNFGGNKTVTTVHWDDRILSFDDEKGTLKRYLNS